MKKRALISVSDKTGVTEFARGLIRLGYEIISTGGTAKTLRDGGVDIIGISDITSFPECLDGRVKTLHPNVHAGILAMRDNKKHMEQLEKLGIDTIDIVAVNLYPFKETISKPDASFGEAVENIDIGGPTMLRSAAKNYKDVLAVVDPSDYAEVIHRLDADIADMDFRIGLMYKVFQHTAVYDTLIAGYLRAKTGQEYPQELTLAFEKKQDLRYGENPHQSAAFYRDALPPKGALAEAKQLHGIELSFNNINDISGALDLLREFQKPAVVAVKHTIPCGVAVKENIYEAYMAAFDSDPVSIYGGIVAANREIDEKTAAEMSKIFLEVVIAPGFTAGALEVLTKKPKVRLLMLENILSRDKQIPGDIKRVSGGVLLQTKNDSIYAPGNVKTATLRNPDAAQLEEMEFAYKIVKHVKSNAIVLTKNFATVGIGSGQTNRIWACNQAIEHAGERAKGAVAASDAYFPFSDCAEALAAAGIAAVIQPGGSIRDQESIDMCNEKGLAMIFVGTRHFKH